MSIIGKIGFVKRFGRDWMVLLLSLLLAFFVWFIHNMSSDYVVYMQYRLSVKTNIAGYSPYSTANEILIVKGKAQGFYILKERDFKKAPSDILLSVDAELFKKLTGEKDVFYLNAEDLEENLSATFGGHFMIDNIESGMLTFYFSKQDYKRLPIVARTSLTYKNQYMLVSDIVLDPDSVTVYGNKEKLEQIENVGTKTIVFDGLSKSVRGIVQPESLEGIRISEEKIKYFIKVDRYVEYTRKIMLSTINLPPNKNLILLPSQITVKYRTPFNSKASIYGIDISIGIDYNDFIKSKSSKVVPIFNSNGLTIYSYEIDPPVIECILTEIN